MAKQVDKKTELTFKTVESLKGSSQAFKEFMQAAFNYQKASLKLAEEGQKMAAALQKIAQLHNTDVGEGIAKLAEHHRNMETKRLNMCRAIQDDLIQNIQKNIKPEEMEVSQFEADYKKARQNIGQQIAKLEANSKKAGKKGAAALQESIRELDAKVKEGEQIKSDKLRNILLIERKKYCNFLGFWAPVINAEIDMHSDGMKLKEQQTYFSNLASSTSNLPPETEALINAKQERTFVQIQGEGDTGYDYSSSYNTSYDNSSYNSGYDNSSYNSGYDNSYNQSYGGGGSNYGTATALYDFAGEQATDLPFYAGNVITITQEDDGSGWLTGELDGRTGIFPANYVQRN